ncbi:hypothetical protein G9A89_001309 [Geosiphon pyriformis]|nr:hypothetical protein G9A89_001309 [Geosiphon pyriformis]
MAATPLAKFAASRKGRHSLSTFDAMFTAMQPKSPNYLLQTSPDRQNLARKPKRSEKCIEDSKSANKLSGTSFQALTTSPFCPSMSFASKQDFHVVFCCGLDLNSIENI